MTSSLRFTLKAAVAVVLLAGSALAGPPLVCHNYSIGNGKSLPWSSHLTSWDNMDPNYKTSNLAADTLRLLDSSTALLTRMETLRRAAVYGTKDHAAVSELAARLIARALAAEVKGNSNSLALFDAGYLVETLRQLERISKFNPVSGVDGSDWARRSLAGLPDKLTGEYALGLMAGHDNWPNEHIKRAVEGATEGSLLAQNIARHFGNKTFQEVKLSIGAKTARR